MEIDVLTCQHHVEHEAGCPSCARDAVFDAAMAAIKNVTVVHDGRRSVIVTMGEDEWLALYGACRKAEEVERG